MGVFLVIVCCATAIGFGQTPQNDQEMLHVREIAYHGEMDLARVAQLLEEQAELHDLSVVNWEAFPYRPEVKFRIAHSNDQIWLRFYVNEENVLAKRTETNSATHRDSCVEFFIDPDLSGNYYNFEFNCIGVTHLAYGPDRSARTFVDPELIQKEIKTASSLGNRPFGERTGGHMWQMTVVVPAAIFVHQKNIQLKHLNAKANFYKCADDTSQRHYLSWNPVKTERPDFHQPVYFGNLVFE
jgi:hypothetical protein